jgi:hypothetical protein
MELVYRDLAVEQARQYFNSFKDSIPETEDVLVLPKPASKRRKRIPDKK